MKNILELKMLNRLSRFLIISFLIILDSQVYSWANEGFKLMTRKSSFVADGYQGVELLIVGVLDGKQDELEWNIPKKSLSRMKFLGKDVLACFYIPESSLAGRKKAKVEVKWNGKSSSIELDLLPKASITFSKKSVVSGSGEKIQISVQAPDDYPDAEFFLGVSQGKLEVIEEGESWNFIPEHQALPYQAWVTLHYEGKPELVLAHETIEVLARKNFSGEFEKDAILWVEMDGQKLGPFQGESFPDIDIRPGIEKIVFIAEDKAGNLSRVEKKVELPPKIDLVLASNVETLPLGGLASRVRVINLGDSVRISDLSVDAKKGSCSPLEPVGNKNFAFIYTSPLEGDTGYDTITIRKRKGKFQAKSQLQIMLTAGVLTRTEMKPLQVKKVEDGSLEIVYQLELYDSNDNLIPESEFKIVSEASKVQHILDLENGKYSFSVKVPPGVSPEEVDLDLRLRPEFFDILTCDILAYPPSTEENDKMLLLATNDEGHPLADVPIIIEEPGKSKRVIKSNALGMINYRSKTLKKVEKVYVSFKGFPQTRKEVLLSHKNLRQVVNSNLSLEVLSDDVLNALEDRRNSSTYNINMTLEKKDGEVVEVTADGDPEKIIIKSGSVIGDGTSKLEIEIVVLSKDGLPIEGQELNVTVDRGGSLGKVFDEGGGKYRAEFTADRVERDETLNLRAEISKYDIKTNSSIDVLAPDQENTSQTTVEATESETPVLTSFEWQSSVAELNYPNAAEFKLLLKDQNSELLSEETTVSISLDASQGSLSATSVKSNQGAISFKYTPVNSNYSIKIKVASGSINTEKSITVKGDASLPDPIPTDIQVQLSREEVVYPDKINLTITAKDQYGNDVADGIEVSASLSLSKGEISKGSISGGICTLEYTPIDEIYQIEFSVKVGEVVQSSSILNVKQKPIPKTIKWLSPSPATEVQAPGDVDALVEVLDQYGQPVTEGEIKFEVDGKGSISPQSSALNGSQIKLVYTMEDESYEPILNAVLSDLEQKLSLKVKASPKASICTLSAASAELTFPATGTIEIEAKDQYGNLVEDGTEVELSLSVDKGKLSKISVVTTSGRASVEYQSIDDTYAITITGKVGEVTGDTILQIKEEEKPPANFLLNSPSSFPKEIRIGDTLKFSLEVLDKNKNQVKDDYDIQLKADSGSLSSNKVKTSSGLIQVEWSPGTSTGKVVLEASYGDAKAWSDSVEVIAGQPDKNKSTLTVSALSVKSKTRSKAFSATADGSSTYLLEAEVRDSFNHRIAKERIEFRLVANSGQGGSLNKDFDITDSNGLASVIYTVGSGADVVQLRAYPADVPNQEFDSVTFTQVSAVAAVLPAVNFRLTGLSSANAGQNWNLKIEALDKNGDLVTSYQGLKNLIFSGASSIGSNHPTAQGSGSATQFGLNVVSSFTAGVANVSVQLVKVETANLQITEGSLTNSQKHVVQVNAGSLSSFELFLVKITGTIGAHLVVTAKDAFGNAISQYDPTADIVFSLQTGTQNGSNLVWSDLSTGITDLRDGRALLSSASFGSFDQKGQLLVGVNNTLAEVNVFKVTEGSVSAVSSSFTWSPDAAFTLIFSSNPPDQATAGQAFSSFSVRVVDQFGNTISSDQGRSLSISIDTGSSTFQNGTAQTVSGVATFSNVIYPSVETIIYKVTATGLASTVGYQTEIVGGTASQFVVTPASSSLTAGQAQTFTILAKNSAGTTATGYTGTVSFSSSDAQAILPANVTFTSADAGQVHVSVTMKTAGSHPLSVSDTTTSSINGTSSNVTVVAAAASQLSFLSDLPKSAVVGSTWSSFSVEVRDAFGNLVVSSDAITLSLQSGTGALSGSLVSNAQNGKAVFTNISYNQVESVSLQAQATGLSAVTSSSIDVAAAGIYNFSIQAPFTNLTVGQASLVNLIKALDADGQTVTSYTGTVSFTSTDGTATLPANYQFQAFENGEHAFTNGITFNSVGTHTYTVVDISKASTATTSSNFQVVSSSKPILSKASYPIIESFVISPQKFNPDLSTPAHNISMAIHLYQNIAGASIRIKWGGEDVKNFQVSDKKGQFQIQWNGQGKNGRSLDNGHYIVELLAFDSVGRSEMMISSIQIDSNFDILQYGP